MSLRSISENVKKLQDCAIAGTELFKADSTDKQFALQILMGSVICAIGFSTNSETAVIGSMLISPIGGLIINMTKLKMSKKSVAFATVLTVFVPFVVGLFAGITHGWIHDTAGEDTSVVEGRGHSLITHPRLWLSGAAIAAAAGVLFSWSDGDTPGIGIGIATALLPPIVAAGYTTGLLIIANAEEGEKVCEKEISFPNARSIGNAFGVFVLNFVILLLACLMTQAKFKQLGCGTGFDITIAGAVNKPKMSTPKP